MVPLEVGQAKIWLHMHLDKHFSHLDHSPSSSPLVHACLYQTLGVSLPSSRKGSLINPIFLMVPALNLPLSHLSYPSPSSHSIQSWYKLCMQPQVNPRHWLTGTFSHSQPGIWHYLDDPGKAPGRLKSSSVGFCAESPQD